MKPPITTPTVARAEIVLSSTTMLNMSGQDITAMVYSKLAENLAQSLMDKIVVDASDTERGEKRYVAEIVFCTLDEFNRSEEESKPFKEQKDIPIEYSTMDEVEKETDWYRNKPPIKHEYPWDDTIKAVSSKDYEKLILKYIKDGNI